MHLLSPFVTGILFPKTPIGGDCWVSNEMEIGNVLICNEFKCTTWFYFVFVTLFSGLFGEDAADRRERLRLLLAISGGPAQRPILNSADARNSTLTARDASTLIYLGKFGV